ncbi:hypothetical protein [Amycolatopsis dendrobii]|uniref:Uncharacterized protein n=1 Tax=Amycolatopsis dendrobii TaxID=2760662 RepID=A0A7W3VUJ9_9PSEU|nr:hypothetical protein [Amycolatopsis dendrobii]MBB1153458.1 hypothetical protein [Amycolatopsis dendrobii]
MPITEFSAPPRLAVGSHPASRLYLCAMNVISWEHGDRPISDTPRCSPLPLARTVQMVNDHFCTHTSEETDPGTGEHVRVLCPRCSVRVLRLAHRTVGAPQLDLRQGWSWTVELLKHALSDGIDPDHVRTIRDAIAIASAHAEGHPPPMPFAAPVSSAAAPMTSLAATIVHNVRAAARPPFMPQKPPAAMWNGLAIKKFEPGATLDDFAAAAEFLYAAHHKPALPTGAVPESAGASFVAGHAGLAAPRQMLGRAHEAIELWNRIAAPEAARPTERVAA